MAGYERRTALRKVCALPVRFRISGDGQDDAERGSESDRETKMARAAMPGQEFVGKALNLSERGLYFTCKENLKIGQPLEMYFILPPELTGRATENVHCRARVVHIDDDGQAGLRGIGACVDRFESMAAAPDWSN